mgnify:CR=1
MRKGDNEELSSLFEFDLTICTSEVVVYMVTVASYIFGLLFGKGTSPQTLHHKKPQVDVQERFIVM